MQRCTDSPTGELLRAFGEFNRGDWFACHETLEELWAGEEGEARDFFQGLLQMAVALHHWREGNFGGAVRLLEGGAAYLRKVRSTCQRIDVVDALASADRMREALIRLGPERMGELAPDLIPRLRLVPAEDAGCRVIGKLWKE